MTTPNQPDSVGTVLKDILRRLRHVETSPRLTSASIKDGALRILDGNDEQRAKFGRLDADYDGDGDGQWALLATIAGVFIRGAIEGGTIDIGGDDASSFHVDAAGNLWVGAALFADAPFRVSAAGDVAVEGGTIEGGTIIGSNIETAAAPAARAKLTDDAPAPYEAALQLFTGTEPAGAQGAVAQYVDPITGRAILFVGPSGLAGDGLAHRAAIFVVSRKPDDTGDREILLMAGEKLYVDAELSDFTGHIHVANRPVSGFRAGLALVGGAVDPSVDYVYEQAGYWDITTNAAGDGVLTWPETFPHGVIDIQVTLVGANNYTSYVFCGIHDNPNTTNVGVRIFDGATGIAVGAGIGFRLSYRVVGW